MAVEVTPVSQVPVTKHGVTQRVQVAQQTDTHPEATRWNVGDCGELEVKDESFESVAIYAPGFWAKAVATREAK